MTVRLLVGGVFVALIVTLLAWGAMRATAAVSAAVKRRMPAKTPARSRPGMRVFQLAGSTNPRDRYQTSVLFRWGRVPLTSVCVSIH